MPHIVVEYPQQADVEVKIERILLAIHQSISDSGLFKAEQIKTRAYPFKVFSNAGENKPYIHIQARIKSGRDIDNKKQLSRVILAGLEPLAIPVSVTTVEIIDMDRDSYGKL